MINRADIEQLLVTNGIPATAPDEEIKSVLVRASWNKEDIDTAILVLRENTATQKQHVDKLHKVFYSDDRLEPEMISQMLGLRSLSVDRSALKHSLQRRRQSTSQVRQMIKAMLLTLVGVILIMVGMLWFYQTGFFYPM